MIAGVALLWGFRELMPTGKPTGDDLWKLFAVAAGGALFVAVYFAARRFEKIHLETERARLAAMGQVAIGVVKELWNDGYEWNITYSFTPSGALGPIERTETIHGKLKRPPEVGDAVEIVYDPRAAQYSALRTPPT